MSDTTCDLVVVGAGILGLAVAREALRRDPDLRVHVVEREERVGAHQTGHNSGVVHAGIYYAPGSLKARLCVEGARDLYAFCERHDVPVEHCGKVIVALTEDEVPGLDALEWRGRQNGVAGLRRLDRTPRASPRCTRRRPGSSTSPPSPARWRAR
jgi:L-2-hydroxyglutarate oxidase LhgO